MLRRRRVSRGQVGTPAVPANRSMLSDEAAQADGAVVEVDGGLAAG
jgi:hypothetical protein